MGKLSLLTELWQFLRVRKKWWLLPILIVIFLLGALLVFVQSSSIAPFIYSII